jgi:CheY-like chemotaxis protein
LWHADIKVPADCITCSDKAKFSQIIINLLGNSVKFTEHGSISLECFIEDNILHIYISDTGQGISKSQQAQLFTPFFQGDAGQMYGGTGLGLTIVKKLVTLLNGNIKLKSQEFKGTRFEIFIPIEKEHLELPHAKHNHAVQMTDFSQRQLTALVVDDVKINCDILTKVLSKLGIKSMQAANGVEALELIKLCKLDILFIDIQMPVMDGFELLERIKQLYPHLLPRTIAISANVYHIDNDYLGRGFQYYITKPFLINEISETVEDILEKMSPDQPID